MQPRTNPPTPDLILTAERVLSNALGQRILLDTGEVLQDGIRAMTYRFCLLEGPNHAPTSVIVKQVKSTDKAPYTPQRATIPAWTFFNEWASLQFLSNEIGENAFGPRFYGGDAAKVIIPTYPALR
jgi:hypothetical protein